MVEVDFNWRYIVCCIVALSSLYLVNQYLPGIESMYYDHTPDIKCDLGIRDPSQKQSLSSHFSVVDNFRCPSPLHLFFI